MDNLKRRRIMKWFIFSLAFVLIVGLGSCTNAQKNIEFKAASYNIRYDAVEDKETGNAWEDRKEAVAKLMIQHDFDIVGTQEGNKRQLEDLTKLMPGYAYIYHSYGGPEGALHNCATFYKTDKFKMLDEGVFWYSETPDKESMGWDATDLRICKWGKFKEKTTGAEFYFFNSHFYWRYVTAKANSGDVMVKKIKEIAGEVPVISTGDLNSQETTPQMQTIFTLLQDAYHLTQTPPEGPIGTGLSGGVFEGDPGVRIDYILVSKQFQVLDYTVIADKRENGHYPADHLPVSSKLSLQLQ